jgi:hypothetical protein
MLLKGVLTNVFLTADFFWKIALGEFFSLDSPSDAEKKLGPMEHQNGSRMLLKGCSDECF